MRWILLALALSVPARADPGRVRRPEQLAAHAPDHIKLQSGGYIGMVTVGLGAALLHDHVNVTAHYGWVPRIVGGTEIHTVSLTIAGRPSRVELGANLFWIPGYFGMGGLYTRGDGFFTRLPAKYPAGYYAPNSLRGFALLGSELELRKHPRTGFASHALFAEVVALDIYVYHWWRNRDSIGWHETLSSAVGYKARLP